MQSHSEEEDSREHKEEDRELLRHLFSRKSLSGMMTVLCDMYNIWLLNMYVMQPHIEQLDYLAYFLNLK